MELNAAFWRNKRVLITGHTGFKGAWLSYWLRQWGADVFGLALPPSTTPSLYQLLRLSDSAKERIADITDPDIAASVIASFSPEIVFHLAAQAIVGVGYQQPYRTWLCNVMGTQLVLDALSRCDSLRAAVMVTTDKVYMNHETQKPFRESDPLGGHDPYSASKAACEMLIQSYRSTLFKRRCVVSARAGNVVGGGDFAPYRLLPEIVQAWSQSKQVHIRQPHSVRPWQHVLDCLQGYLRLAQHIVAGDTADAYNFGPPAAQFCTVESMLHKAKNVWPNCAGWQVQSAPWIEAQWLTLDSQRAVRELGWQCVWDLDVTIEKTLTWYRAFYNGENIEQLTHQQWQCYLDGMRA